MIKISEALFSGQQSLAVVGLGYAESVAHLHRGNAHTPSSYAPLKTHRCAKIVGVEGVVVEIAFATHKFVTHHRGCIVLIGGVQKYTRLNACREFQKASIARKWNGIMSHKRDVEVVERVAYCYPIAILVAIHALLREGYIQSNAPPFVKIAVARKAGIQTRHWCSVVDTHQPRQRHAISYAKTNGLSHKGVANGEKCAKGGNYNDSSGKYKQKLRHSQRGVGVIVLNGGF